MPIALPSLTPAQVRMLIRLDDGPEEDSVGIEMDGLKAWQVDALVRLRDLGLVEMRVGWRNTMWFRLTPNGRATLAALPRW